MQHSQDCKTILKYQRKNGSLFNSPATTAAVFQRLKNAECLGYLQSVLEKFGNAGTFPNFISLNLSLFTIFRRIITSFFFSNQFRQFTLWIYMLVSV